MTSEKRSVYLELFALSTIALFFELLVIRWMAGDFRGVAVFRTFPLITCFVGLGAGFALGKDNLYKTTPLALLFFVISMRLAEYFKLGFFGFPSQAVFNWQSLPSGDSVGLAYFVIFSIVLITLLAGPFWVSLCLGARLGVVFNRLPALKAYSINLFGSIVGSLLFTLLSFLEAPPWELLIVTAAMIVPFAAMKKWPIWLAGGIAIGVIAATPSGIDALPLSESFGAFQDGGVKTLWSPYQRLDLRTYADQANGKKRFLGLELGVNRLFYQYFIPPELPVDSFPPVFQRFVAVQRDQYSLPEKIKTPGDVLVLAAGTGQDVAAAIVNGAKNVDAVDIDPVILDQGRRFDPLYSTPNVHLFCDDARHYINLCQKKYDLIVFSFLDSHAVLGQGSSVRLDSYPYTREGLKNALRLLKPDGVMVISFSAVADWLERRIFRTIKEAAGYDPVVIGGKEGRGHVFFVVGADVAKGLSKAPEGWVAQPSPKLSDSDRLLTDDWPYLYVRPDIVDVPYLVIISEILLIALLAGARVLSGPRTPLMGQMFALGSAFLLLELHAISFLSLLYGSTWLTSAIVINGILVMLLIANLSVMRLDKVIQGREWVVFVALFISIAINYFLPSAEIVGGRSLGNYIVVTAITLLPILFAGCLFPVLFEKAENPSKALAYNLFGSVVGGLLEYSSNFLGIKNLLLVALALYLVAFLFQQMRPKSAGVNFVSEQ